LLHKGFSWMLLSGTRGTKCEYKGYEKFSRTPASASCETRPLLRPHSSTLSIALHLSFTSSIYRSNFVRDTYPLHAIMRFSQAALVAILAATVVAKPIVARTEDSKAMEEYNKCCESRDKHDPKLVCIPPRMSFSTPSQFA
jgi:hypothetical protein